MLPPHHFIENQLTDWNLLQFLPFYGGRQSKARKSPPTSHDEKESSRPKVGLVLSSGAAKGLAHIGVIQVLEENGIKIDAVAATSMGAYVAACWNSGMNGEELESLAAEIGTSHDRLQLLDPVFPPRRGFMRGERIRARLKRSIGDLQFDELHRKTYVIATEMGTYEAHIFDRGSVVDAVHASLAIPGIFTPVNIEGHDYVDGGVSDPLPVQALLMAGMDKIIAVCVLPTVEELRVCKEHELLQAKRARWNGKMGRFLNTHLNYFARGNVLDVLRNSVMGSQIRVAEFNAALADVYLRPIVCTGSWHDYHNYRHYVAKGREVAEANIERIRALVSSPEPARVAEVSTP